MYSKMDIEFGIMGFNVHGAQWMNKSNSNQERVKNNMILLKKRLFENKRPVFHPSFPLEQVAKQFWWLFHSSPHNEPFDKYKFGISKQISFIWQELTDHDWSPGNFSTIGALFYFHQSIFNLNSVIIVFNTFFDPITIHCSLKSIVIAKTHAKRLNPTMLDNNFFKDFYDNSNGNFNRIFAWLFKN